MASNLLLRLPSIDGAGFELLRTAGSLRDGHAENFQTKRLNRPAAPTARLSAQCLSLGKGARWCAVFPPSMWCMAVRCAGRNT